MDQHVIQPHRVFKKKETCGETDVFTDALVLTKKFGRFLIVVFDVFRMKSEAGCCGIPPSKIPKPNPPSNLPMSFPSPQAKS